MLEGLASELSDHVIAVEPAKAIEVLRDLPRCAVSHGCTAGAAGHGMRAGLADALEVGGFSPERVETLRRSPEIAQTLSPQVRFDEVIAQ